MPEPGDFERAAKLRAFHQMLQDARDDHWRNGAVSPDDVRRAEAEQEARWASEKIKARTRRDR